MARTGLQCWRKKWWWWWWLLLCLCAWSKYILFVLETYNCLDFEITFIPLGKQCLWDHHHDFLHMFYPNKNSPYRVLWDLLYCLANALLISKLFAEPSTLTNPHKKNSGEREGHCMLLYSYHKITLNHLISRSKQKWIFQNY